MSLKTKIEELHRRLGEDVFLSALEDTVAGRRDSKSEFFLRLLSVLVVSIPFLLAAAGLWLAWIGFPHILIMIVAALVLALAYFLRPRRYALPPDLLGRSDLPELFTVLDAICDRLRAPRFTHVFVDLSFNAAVVSLGNVRVLVLGAPLWLGLRSGERMAILAHETAHLVNNDARRKGALGQALDQLSRWSDLLAPDLAQDWYSGQVSRVSYGFVADFLLTFLRCLVEALHFTLLRLSYFGAQRSEYLADALAAQVAGKEAVLTILDNILIMDGPSPKIAGIEPRKGEAGLTFLQRLANGAVETDPKRQAEIRARHMQNKLAVNGTHPPSCYRKAFVEALDEHGETLAIGGNWAVIDAELAPHFEQIGERLMVLLERQ